MQLTRDRTHVPSEFQARQLSRSSGRSIPETFARVTNKCAAPVLAKEDLEAEQAKRRATETATLQQH